MDVSGKPVNSESLEMAKKRDKKVYITDIAIDKVPLIEYYGLTDEQNQIIDFFIGGCAIFCSASYAYSDSGGIESGNCPLSETR